MSPNELSSALKCFLELTVCQRSAETTYKQELDFVRSYCYVWPTGNIKTVWKVEELTVTIMSNFMQSDDRKKEERKSRIFMSFDVKLNMPHWDIDRGSFDARGTVSNDSDVCFIHFLLLRAFVFLFLSWCSY